MSIQQAKYINALKKVDLWLLILYHIIYTTLEESYSTTKMN